MPARSLQVDGQKWDVSPSGYITQYTQDEYALMFSKGSGKDREHYFKLLFHYFFSLQKQINSMNYLIHRINLFL